MKYFLFNAETLRSRTFWAGAMAIATAAATLHGAERLLGILGGLATIFMRDAITTQGAAQANAPASAIAPREVE